MIRVFLRIFGLLLIAAPCIAYAQQNGVQVQHTWSRATVPGQTGVIYLTISDTGAPDRLTSVASPVAASAALHESFSENGVSKMREIAGLAVSPGAPVTLAPGGYHIMLMGLKQPLKQGDAFPVTLTFEKAGAVTATVTVEKPGAGAPAAHGARGGATMPTPAGGAQGKAP
jgi:periplasmic copper chaperone A